MPGQPDRPAQVQHNPDVPSFNANARPMQQQAPAVEGQAGVPNNPRFQPRVPPQNRVEQGGEGESRIDPARVPRAQQAIPQSVSPVEGVPPRLERPNREMRNIQPRPQQIAPIERPQQIAPAAPAAPVAPAPQPQVQPQRAEVPRPPQAEARAIERGPGREGREPPGREGPNRVNQER